MVCSKRPSLAVIGGGLAGIAAAEAAARRGFDVHLFEWSRVLGGRAASVYDPVAECWIDNGQHIALGCCNELLALNERLGLDSFFEQKNSIPFAQSDGKHWNIAATSFLPKRWQLIPAFLTIPLLSLRQRISTAFVLRKLSMTKITNQTQDNTNQNTSSQNSLSQNNKTQNPFNHHASGFFAEWLEKENVSEQCIEKFWEPVILSTLCETIKNVSFDAVQKVATEGLMAGKKGLTVYIPTKPLREIYHNETAERLKAIGVKIHFMSRLSLLHWDLLPENSLQKKPPATDREDNNSSDNNSDDNNSAETDPNNTESKDQSNNDDSQENSQETDEPDTTQNNELADERLELELRIDDVAAGDKESDKESGNELGNKLCGGVGCQADVFCGLEQRMDSSDCYFDYRVPFVVGLEFSDGEVLSFDRYILAVPSFRAREIFDASELETFSDGLGLAGFEPGAITSVHLWLNRRLLPVGCDHTALVGGVGQFLFCPKSVDSGSDLFYHLVVISASHRVLTESELASSGTPVLVENVMRQLESTFIKHKHGEKNIQDNRNKNDTDKKIVPNKNESEDKNPEDKNNDDENNDDENNDDENNKSRGDESGEINEGDERDEIGECSEGDERSVGGEGGERDEGSDSVGGNESVGVIELYHYRVTTCFDAVFSPHPLVYSHRPSQKTPFANLAIAGDWTQTGLPATLEGAVRSGLAAVEAVCCDNESL